MPNDIVYLLVDGKRIENFTEYVVDADLYCPDHAFSLELSNPEVRLRSGLLCELYVNDTRELVGLIDRIEPSFDKSGRKLVIEGRDLMGLIEDAYCEQFITIQGKKIKDIAETLLAQISFIDRKRVIYQENVTGSLRRLKKRAGGYSAVEFLDVPLTYAQIEPGMTVFEVLKDYAHSRGLMFWGMPDGSFVFGRPLTGGRPFFEIITRIGEPEKNNAMSGKKIDDISRRYSKVTVIGQQQGTDSMGADISGPPQINTSATKENKEWPFYENGKVRLYKPFVAKNNNDYQSPALNARLLLEKQKHEGFKLKYRMPGHSQNGANWAINQMCNVDDEANDVKGNFLITGRTMRLSKEEGVLTVVRLGYPGLVE